MLITFKLLQIFQQFEKQSTQKIKIYHIIGEKAKKKNEPPTPQGLKGQVGGV